MTKPKDKAYIWRSRCHGGYEWIVQWPRGQRIWRGWGPIRTAYDTFDQARLAYIRLT
jgi:hypothetical protein